MQQVNCRDCRFYDPTEHGYGICRRNPPTPSKIRDSDTDAPAEQRMRWAEWPNVTDGDWCGAAEPDGE